MQVTKSQAQALAPVRSLSLPAARTEAPAEPTPASIEPQELGEIAAEKDWTVLFYLNGNNAESSAMTTAMRQLEFVGSDTHTHMAAQLARPKAALDGYSKDWNGVRRYEIKNNGQKFNAGAVVIDGLTGSLPGKTKGIKSPVLQELDANTDMASKQTLQQFLEWGVQKFPAKNYMVVMMGPSEGVSGTMHDTKAGTKMSVADLGEAFAGAQKTTGKKIDLLALNGSATSSLEVANELSGKVKYLVGSQGIQTGQSMPMAMVMNEIANINKEGGRDASSLAGYMLLMNSMAPGALSVMDLDKMGPATESWNALSSGLLAANVSRDKLNSLLASTQNFAGASTNTAYGNSRDAIHFAQNVAADSSLSHELRELGSRTAEALEATLAGDVANGKGLENANGISVFAPTRYGFFRPGKDDPLRDGGYAQTSFAQNTQWDELLSAAAKDTATNNVLKSIGLSETGVDQAHAYGSAAMGVANLGLGIAGMAGYMNGINAWRGTEAASFLVGPTVSAYAGSVAAGADALKGVGRAIGGVSSSDSDEVAQGLMDVAAAGAKGVANLGYVVPALQPYASTAGMLMFMSPWLRNVYGVYQQYKQIKDGIELGVGDNSMPQAQQWASAAVRYYGGRTLHDHAEPTLLQKLTG